jgi:hypothetical protein
MNQHLVNTDRRKKYDIAKKALDQVIILHGASAVLNDECLTAKPLNKRQRLK